MNQAIVLAQVARSFGERPAISVGERVLHDYRGFADRVARIAAGFHRLGLVHGDRVALVMKNGAEYFEVMYGAWHARSEEHTSELQSLMRISYAVFCLKK